MSGQYASAALLGALGVVGLEMKLPRALVAVARGWNLPKVRVH